MTKEKDKITSGLEAEIEIKLENLEETDHFESIASTIEVALYNENNKVLTLIFADLTDKQTIKKFINEGHIICSILDKDGKKKKSQPLKMILQRFSGPSVTLKFGIDLTMDSMTSASTGLSRSDITTGDKIAFSTMELGCIRVLTIINNFLLKKVNQTRRG